MNSERNSSRSNLINAIISNDKNRLRKALGIKKPIKMLFFSHKEGKVIFNKDLTDSFNNKTIIKEVNEAEITLQEMDSIIKEEGEVYELMIFNTIHSPKGQY